MTRDRIYSHGEWLATKFAMIDTGGIQISDAPFATQIKSQAEIAIDEADVIVFIVSGKEGVTADDEQVAKILYRSDKPVVLAVNKVDNPESREDIYEFYSLGFGDPMPISGVHGLGLGDLLDKVVEKFPKTDEKKLITTISDSASLAVPTLGNHRWLTRFWAKIGSLFQILLALPVMRLIRVLKQMA